MPEINLDSGTDAAQINKQYLNHHDGKTLAEREGFEPRLYGEGIFAR
jgi:hypothetical protein